MGLRETEDYDRHYIALSKAASLIRQKSGFGKEVIDHVEELASVLINLNDQFEFDDFVTNKANLAIFASIVSIILVMFPYFYPYYSAAQWPIRRRYNRYCNKSFIVNT